MFLIKKKNELKILILFSETYLSHLLLLKTTFPVIVLFAKFTTPNSMLLLIIY